jgi:hypothetical protein
VRVHAGYDLVLARSIPCETNSDQGLFIAAAHRKLAKTVIPGVSRVRKGGVSRLTDLYPLELGREVLERPIQGMIGVSIVSNVQGPHRIHFDFDPPVALAALIPLAAQSALNRLLHSEYPRRLSPSHRLESHQGGPKPT